MKSWTLGPSIEAKEREKKRTKDRGKPLTGRKASKSKIEDLTKLLAIWKDAGPRGTNLIK